jgi:hypothetical protein
VGELEAVILAAVVHRRAGGESYQQVGGAELLPWIDAAEYRLSFSHRWEW